MQISGELATSDFHWMNWHEVNLWKYKRATLKKVPTLP